ncbi:MAG: ATP-binding protein [Candidatus Methanosuratus sp.]|nr:ATP-binding protein [Candidatus Methanosuratincola sp.]
MEKETDVESREVEYVGQIVSGNDSEFLLREKQGAKLELGDLLVVDNEGVKYICMVSELSYGSLIAPERILTSAGSILEGVNPRLEFPEKDLRIFRQIHTKPLLEVISEGERMAGRAPRSIPEFMSKARVAEASDFSFMEEPRTKVFIGDIRSGGKTLPVGFSMDGEKLLSHHVLISAQTGRGKSNLVKVLLWEAMKHEKFGVLVMDVHNEYYGTTTSPGLKDHPNARRVLRYYSRSPPPGGQLLKINLKSIDVDDLKGIVEFTEAQEGTLEMLRREKGAEWISALLEWSEDEKGSRKPTGTIRVLKRKICNIFNLNETPAGYVCEDGVFDLGGMGEETINDMARALEDGKVVLIDGSSISDDAGLVIASAVIRKLFDRYEEYKLSGTIHEKAQIGVVLEEAPRVLDVAHGGNIFSRIAREGRKFKIGLIAITQLASVIPKDILANIGTKVIMGNEMAQERRVLVENAAQDLSGYDRIIAGLEVGEAIVSSIFSKFPVPVKIPKFEEIAGSSKAQGRGQTQKQAETPNMPPVRKTYF